MSPSTYRRRIAKLRDILADAEWHRQSYNGYPSCPVCAEYQHDGHAVGCSLGAELAKGKA